MQAIANVQCLVTQALLVQELARMICVASAEAIAERGTFTIALSGGSLPTVLADALAYAKHDGTVIEFDKWVVIYADERIVPFANADSNHKACFAALESAGALGVNYVVIDPGLSPDACALDYEFRMRKVLGLADPAMTPCLDFVLLGMGPDGHTASLFPGKEGHGALVMIPT